MYDSLVGWVSWRRVVEQIHSLLKIKSPISMMSLDSPYNISAAEISKIHVIQALTTRHESRLSS